MIRFLFRALAALLLAVAILLAVVDVTRSVATSAAVVTPFAETWEAWSPAGLKTARSWMLGSAGQAGWDIVSLAIGLPGFVLFALLALFFYAIGHRRTPRSRRLATRA